MYGRKINIFNSLIFWPDSCFVLCGNFLAINRQFPSRQARFLGSGDALIMVLLVILRVDHHRHSRRG